MDANTPVITYNKAVDDYNELGGIDGIAEIMKWDSAQKQNWLNRIININFKLKKKHSKFFVFY